MSAEENKATLLRLVEGFNKGNMAIIDEVFFLHRYPPFSLSSPMATRARRCRALLKGARRDIPDLHATIEDIFATGTTWPYVDF